MSRLDKINELYQGFKRFIKENPWDEIPETLIEIDQLIRDILDWKVSQERSERREQEEEIIFEATGERTNIDEILNELAEKVLEILSKNSDEIDKELAIYVVELSQTILPPWEWEIYTWEKRKKKFNQKKELLESRYGKILKILIDNGVYANDIIVYKGKNGKNSMRETTYRAIQIPKFWVTIFVCDEYSQATFIVPSIIHYEVFTNTTKSDIRKVLKAQKIKNKYGWEFKFINIFLGLKEREKAIKKDSIDVREWLKLIKEIKKIYPTPESFMEVPILEKRKLKVLWKWIQSVWSIIFWRNTTIKNSWDFTKLAQRIYGEGHTIIDCEFWGKEQWLEIIMKVYPKADNFMKLSQKEKDSIKIYWKWLGYIWKLILWDNIPQDSRWRFNPVWYIEHHAFIAREIYGEWHDIIECEILKEDWWEKEIKKLYRTPEEFMLLKTKEKLTLKIHWKWLTYIGNSILWDKAPDGFNPIGDVSHHALLAKAIYGEWYDIIDCEFFSRIQRIESVKKSFPEYKKFLLLSSEIKKRIKIHWKWLTYIGSIILWDKIPKNNSWRFNPISYSTHHRVLAWAIYWEETL